MPDYQFTGLSPDDFERLVRDLLQKELGFRLQAFSRGQDKGIDLRYSRNDSDLVVQCKHYPHSNWSSLRRELSSEVQKVASLQPSRYLVATSMGLSPQRKDEINQLFAGYLLSTDDIYGRDDLNNLLGRFPEVEKQHYKLWLTSLAVLTRVLNAAIFSEQKSELDSLRRRVCRFVPNPSVDRALKLLDEQNIAVVTGVPGIGKTTLAEILLIEHLERGYECFRIWHGVEEVRDVYNVRDRQLFYFDDFLGRTGLRHEVLRNEDERLVRLIRDIGRSANTRMVLTTREYILNQARSFMEGLQSAELDVAKCVVDLGDYTPMIRAKILYNHLYFSDVPYEHVDALVRAKSYREIVRHRNYSPRILEAMTEGMNLRTIEAEEYPKRFIASLDNPASIWQTAYRTHLSTEAQDLLLAAVALPDLVRLEHVSRAYDSLSAVRSNRYGRPRDPYGFERAVKELEGTFIRTELQHGEIGLQLQNPSVRDFLENHLRGSHTDVQDILQGSLFASQVASLWQILRPGEGGMGAEITHAVVHRYWDHLETEDVGMGLISYYDGSRRWQTPRTSVIERGLVLLEMIECDPTFTGSDVLTRVFDRVTSYVQSGSPERRELTSLLDRFLLSPINGVDSGHELFGLGMEVAFESFEDLSLDDFQALVSFMEDHGDIVGARRSAIVAEAFGDFAPIEEDAIRSESDQSTRVSWYEELETLAETLGVPLELTRAELEDDNEYDVDDDDRWEEGRSAGSGGEVTDAALDRIFDSLREGR